MGVTSLTGQLRHIANSSWSKSSHVYNLTLTASQKLDILYQAFPLSVNKLYKVGDYILD